jgi:diguanylate cyclase (GGDEF)-like protein
VDFIYGYIGLAINNLVGFFLSTILCLYFRKSANILNTSLLILLIYTAVVYGFLYQERGEFDGFYWSILFPVISIFLLGNRLGTLLSSLFFIGIFLLLLNAESKLESIMNISIAYLSLVFLIRFYEKSRSSAIDLVNSVNIELYSSAITDPLTGLMNRRGLYDYIKNIDQNFSMALLDIDHFKKVNDTYGHDIGDTVLQEISKVLKGDREVDLAVRYGGEEFLLILRGENRDILRVCNRLRENIKSLKFMGDKKEIFRVTSSFGVAHSQKGVDDIEVLIAKADKALYRAKNSGRDRVVVS